MWMLVSLERTKAALRIDTTDDDEILEFYISAASVAVRRYLKGQASEVLNLSDSPPNSPPDALPDDLDLIEPDVAMAVIAFVGILYKQPDGDDARNFAELGYLPYIVTALLYPLRDPALA
jgi:hypothetical protein